MPLSNSKRAEVSRANGAKSRGPVSSAGKLRSSQNSIRHGLLAKCILIKYEDRECFQKVLDYHIATFKPTDEVQLGLIEEMVAAQWRMRRTWTIETNLFDVELEKRTESTSERCMAATFSELAGGNQLNLLDRYESRLQRMYHRSFKTLRELQQLQTDQEDPEIPNEPNELDPDPEIQPVPNEPNSPNPEPPSPSPTTGSSNPDTTASPSSGVAALVRAESPHSAAQQPEIQPLPNEPKKESKPADTGRIQQKESVPLEYVYKLVRGPSGSHRLERIR